jgi:light-regulated signal transduction histidine kinase (bacteriophytochrome)
VILKEGREIDNTRTCYLIKNTATSQITDNGIGFENQYKDRIFQVFQRLHAKNEYDGTGIGLSIVKKIVETHGGIITASGEPNKGSTFDIFLPIK